MKLSHFIKYLFLIFTFCTYQFNSERISKNIRSTNSWEYLAKFAFVELDKTQDSGSLEFRLKIDKKSVLNQNLAIQFYFIFESYDEWADIYNSPFSKYTCQDRRSLADINVPISGKTEYIIDEDDDFIIWERSFIFDTKKDRFMFISLSNCASRCPFIYNSNNDVRNNDNDVQYCQGPIIVDAEMRFLNPERDGSTDKEGNAIRTELPADLMGFHDFQITMVVFYSILVLFSYFLRQEIMRKQKYHFTIKLLIFSVSFNFIGQIIRLAYFNNFKDNGINNQRMRVASEIFVAASDIMLIIITNVLAKGVTIYRRKLSINGRIKLAVFCTFYACIHYIYVVWDSISYNPALIYFTYESPPGILFVILRCFASIWFLRSSILTYITFRRKHGYLKKFVFFVFLWYLSLPLLVLLSKTVEDTCKLRVVRMSYDIITLLLQIIFFVIYDPRTKCRSFPFHNHNHLTKSQRLQNIGVGIQSKTIRNPFPDFHDDSQSSNFRKNDDRDDEKVFGLKEHSTDTIENKKDNIVHNSVAVDYSSFGYLIPDDPNITKRVKICDGVDDVHVARIKKSFQKYATRFKYLKDYTEKMHTALEQIEIPNQLSSSDMVVKRYLSSKDRTSIPKNKKPDDPKPTSTSRPPPSRNAPKSPPRGPGNIYRAKSSRNSNLVKSERSDRDNDNESRRSNNNRDNENRRRTSRDENTESSGNTDSNNESRRARSRDNEGSGNTDSNNESRRARSRDNDDRDNEKSSTSDSNKLHRESSRKRTTRESRGADRSKDRSSRSEKDYKNDRKRGDRNDRRGESRSNDPNRHKARNEEKESESKDNNVNSSGFRDVALKDNSETL